MHCFYSPRVMRGRILCGRGVRLGRGGRLFLSLSIPGNRVTHTHHQPLPMGAAAFLLGGSSAVCTRQPPTASMLARFRLPAWSSVWLLRLRTGSDFALERLPAPDVMFFTCPPLCAGALWPMPAWPWHHFFQFVLRTQVCYTELAE